jgi:hypothetical protein
MKWLIFTAPDSNLWCFRPSYNDGLRPRKPEYASLNLPLLAPKQKEVTLGDVTVTLGGATVGGISIYSETDEERIAQWLTKATSAAETNIPISTDTPHHIVDHTEVPSDHPCGIQCAFRNAWEWTGAVTVNMAKARLIQMESIRLVRNAELAKLDVPFMRAVEAEDTDAQATIATEKQTLRDIPTTFDITTVDTPEKLKAKWPSELPARG